MARNIEFASETVLPETAFTRAVCAHLWTVARSGADVMGGDLQYHVLVICQHCLEARMVRYGENGGKPR
jgi:hypothetical protein